MGLVASIVPMDMYARECGHRDDVPLPWVVTAPVEFGYPYGCICTCHNLNCYLYERANLV